MSSIIGANATRLVGLLTDSLQKALKDEITLDQWERFNDLSPKAREEWFGEDLKAKQVGAKSLTQKFKLHSDLGIITVPSDYNHETYVSQVVERSNLDRWSRRIIDYDFRHPSRILLPGERLHVRLFEQTASGKVGSLQRIEFLVAQNAVFVGAQGICLVFEQKLDQLPRNKSCVSYDLTDRLPVDNGHFQVPAIWIDPNPYTPHPVFGVGISLRTSPFSLIRGRRTLVFCFTEVS